MQMTKFMDNHFRYLKAGKKEYTEEEVRTIIDGAIAAEREACALVVEEWLHGEWHNQGVVAAMMIRARGQG